MSDLDTDELLSVAKLAEAIYVLLCIGSDGTEDNARRTAEDALALAASFRKARQKWWHEKTGH